MDKVEGPSSGVKRLEKVLLFHITYEYVCSSPCGDQEKE
jgi:hypothetical protein